MYVEKPVHQYINSNITNTMKAASCSPQSHIYTATSLAILFGKNFPKVCGLTFS